MSGAHDANASLDVLALCAADVQRRVPRPFFVQIGAHDGASLDPIRPFVDAYAWDGLLVEPQPQIFERLTRNYHGRRGLIFENVAISDTEGSATLFGLAPSPDLPDHASMLASFDRSSVEQNGHGYVGEIVELAVQATTINALLSKHGIERVDILQIDTEGYDFRILEMFDFARWQPELIHFENAFMTPEQRARVYLLLVAQGLRLLELGIDTIAYRQDASPAYDERAAMSHAGITRQSVKPSPPPEKPVR